MPKSCSRRSLLIWAAAAAALPRIARAQRPTSARLPPTTPTPTTSPEGPTTPTATPPTTAPTTPNPSPNSDAPPAQWSLPIRLPGDIPGNGLIVRHGFACENTWFSPGNWHTAEDWYRDGDANTVGAEVLAMTAGEVLWIGSDYPGRVVLILHTNGLHGMYGHLDYAVDVAVGQQVAAGQVLGRVLDWRDGRAPSHLHVEMRDFFLNPIVNGDTPRYGFNCGYRCPPGPGYWPIADSKHPAQVGWRNPSHVIAQGLASLPAPAEVVVAAGSDGTTASLLDEPDAAAPVRSQVQLRAGMRFPVGGVVGGAPDSTETSALAYEVWYEVRLAAGSRGWMQGMVPDARDTGSDGRPSSVRPVLLPVPRA